MIALVKIRTDLKYPSPIGNPSHRTEAVKYDLSVQICVMVLVESETATQMTWTRLAQRG